MVRCDPFFWGGGAKRFVTCIFSESQMCFIRLLLILIFSALFSATHTFLLCRDQDGISFGLNGKTAERERSMRVERAEPRSEIRSLVCHPADVLPLRWERDGARTRLCVSMYVCMRISRQKTIKGLREGERKGGTREMQPNTKW